MAELTTYGFERENRTDITSRLNTAFRNKFGANLLLTDDSIAGMIRSIFAERELEFEKLLEDVYYARTLNGAEGVALDDAASYYGFTREGPTASSGVAHIQFVDNGTNLGTSVTTDDTFSASNGLTYQVSSGGTLNSNITGAVIDVNTLSIGDYRFFMTSTITGEVVETTISLPDLSSVSIDSFAISLVSFVTTNTEGNDSVVFQQDGIVYIGYLSSDTFAGLAQPLYFESIDLPSGFTYWAGYDVEATETGYNPLEVGEITSFSNPFSGYNSATNTTEFNSGSENETDAEFRLRIQTQELSTPAGTRDAIATAVSEVDGVVSYRVYDNPTLTDRAEADALSFNVVVRGGINSDIAKAIYDNKPINTQTSGTTVVAVDTANGEQENIFFTEAEEASYDLRITYMVNNTTPLSSTEQASIEEAVEALLDSQMIGDGVTNTQLVSAILVSLSTGRLLDVGVELKRTSDPESSFSKSGISLDYDEYASVSSFTYEREV